MKTSNKILLTAFSVYLLLTAASLIGFKRNYNSIKEEATSLLRQLEQHRIHTLVNTGERYISVRKTKGPRQFIGWWDRSIRKAYVSATTRSTSTTDGFTYTCPIWKPT